MKRYLYIVVLALICAVPIWAQEEFDAHLVGHVLDEKTGEHLPYVNVQVKGTNIGTVTDESGHFFLKNLPLGKQTIVFSYVGYENLELPVKIEENKTTAVACVADALNFQPGLRVENTCSNCGKTELRINGLQGQYTQRV